MKTFNNIFNDQVVKLADIDLNDETFCITTETGLKDLILSIKSVGLLNPPLLIGNNAHFTIVCGFRRIKACLHLGWSHVQARIIAPETKKLGCAKIAITDNILQRPLNLIELSRSINLVAANSNKNNKLSAELSALGLPHNQAVLKKINKLCHLSQPIQNGILSGTISLAMALELGRLAPETGNDFATIFGHLRLSLNKQREIVTLVKEIATRENVAINEVLKDDFMLTTIRRTELDNNQKARLIRIYLRKRRFPIITRAENAFEQLVSDLKLGRQIKLSPPPDFEGTAYTLNLKFNSMAEINAHMKTLGAMIQNPIFNKIINKDLVNPDKT